MTTKYSGYTVSQDARYFEDKSARPPTRQAAINAIHKINKLLENNA